VEGNQTTAGVEALVLQDGACVLAHDLFLKLLKSYAPKVSLTFEGNEKSIRFATTALPISSYAATAVPPGHFQTMAVTDLSVLLPSKATVPQPASSAEKITPPLGPLSSFCSSYPWEENWTEALGALVRRLCAMKKVNPQQLIGLARGLYALEQMPLTTPGVSVEVSVGWRSEEKPGGTWRTVAGCFLVSDSCLRCDWYSGGGDGEGKNENSVTTEYEERTRTDQFRLEPDEESYCRLVSWFEAVWEFIDDDRAEFYVAVADDSSPEAVPRATMGPQDEE
jgi:hypothetical protein